MESSQPQPLRCGIVSPTQASFPVLQPTILVNVSLRATARCQPLALAQPMRLQQGTWDWFCLGSPVMPPGFLSNSSAEVYLVRFSVCFFVIL